MNKLYQIDYAYLDDLADRGTSLVLVYDPSTEMGGTIHKCTAYGEDDIAALNKVLKDNFDVIDDDIIFYYQADADTQEVDIALGLQEELGIVIKTINSITGD